MTYAALSGRTRQFRSATGPDGVPIRSANTTGSCPNPCAAAVAVSVTTASGAASRSMCSMRSGGYSRSTCR